MILFELIILALCLIVIVIMGVAVYQSCNATEIRVPADTAQADLKVYAKFYIDRLDKACTLMELWQIHTAAYCIGIRPEEMSEYSDVVRSHDVATLTPDQVFLGHDCVCSIVKWEQYWKVDPSGYCAAMDEYRNLLYRSLTLWC